MAQKITINDFNFEKSSYGRYIVTYTSPKTGKSYVGLVTDMTIIDATKNADEPKRKDLEQLKKICKNGFC